MQEGPGPYISTKTQHMGVEPTASLSTEGALPLVLMPRYNRNDVLRCAGVEPALPPDGGCTDAYCTKLTDISEHMGVEPTASLSTEGARPLVLMLL